MHGLGEAPQWFLSIKQCPLPNLHYYVASKTHELGPQVRPDSHLPGSDGASTMFQALSLVLRISGEQDRPGGHPQ